MLVFIATREVIIHPAALLLMSKNKTPVLFLQIWQQAGMSKIRLLHLQCAAKY